jgi:FMN phosphatase YigB (HAD superfamily)
VSGLRAVTFDFWSTLVDGEMTPERTTARMARLHAALVGAGAACSPAELGRAFERAITRVADDARETLADVGPPGRWAVVAEELGLPRELIPFEVVERAYEDLTLNPPPAAMPHVHVALDAMRRAGYALGVICNTGMAGGRTLREVLRHHGLLDYFAVTVFSNEFGHAKPHPSIFAHTLDALGGIPPRAALHVGDLEELDVEGARAAGVHVARYVCGATEPIVTDADFAIGDWRDFGPRLAAFAAAR